MMRPSLIVLLLTSLALFACHKDHKKPADVQQSNVWRWVSYSLPGGGLRQPGKDSAVFLVLSRDSVSDIFINGFLGSMGLYKINQDSNFMTFSVRGVLTSDSLQLCTSCALTISRDTITLRAPSANPANYGVFTFVRPNPMPPCINCSL